MLNIKRIVNINMESTPPLTGVRGFGPGVIIDNTGKAGSQTIYKEFSSADEVYKQFSDCDIFNMSQVYFGAFSDNNSPNKLYVMQYANDTKVDDAMLTLNSHCYEWYVAIPTKAITNTDINSISQSIEAAGTNVLFTSLLTIPESQKALSDTSINPFYGSKRTSVWFSPDNLLPSAMAGLMATVDLTQIGAQLNYAFKTPSIVKPQDVSAAQADVLEAAFVNYFTNIGGTNMTYKGFMSDGSYIDFIQQKDFMKASIENALKDMFLEYKTIPYDETGYSIIERTISSICEGFHSTGLISQEKINGVVYKDGFKVTLPDLSTVSVEDKQNRILNNIQITLIMSGAVESIVVNAYLK